MQLLRNTNKCIHQDCTSHLHLTSSLALNSRQYKQCIGILCLWLTLPALHSMLLDRSLGSPCSNGNRNLQCILSISIVSIGFHCWLHANFLLSVKIFPYVFWDLPVCLPFCRMYTKLVRSAVFSDVALFSWPVSESKHKNTHIYTYAHGPVAILAQVP